MTEDWRACASGIRADAHAVAEGRSKYPCDEEPVATVQPSEQPSVLALYEETLCRPLKAAIKLKRAGK